MVKALLHCPRVLNWIETHRNSITPYVCAYGQNHRRCSTCAFQRLASAYWTDETDHNVINQKALDLDAAAFRQGLSMPWYQSRHGMEDPSQYAEHLINAFSDSNQNDANLPVWQDQASAMLATELIHTDTCTGCNHVTTCPEGRMFTFQVPVNSIGHDTLLQAINWKLVSSIQKKCGHCSVANIGHDTVTKIQAGPQVLVIQLLIFQNLLRKKNYSEEADEYELVKLNAIVNFPKMLNISRQQTDTSKPLKYKLQAVTSHQGDHIDAGHYMGQLKPPTGFYETSDLTVVPSSVAEFTEWLRLWKGEDFTPYILTYVMDFGI